MIRLLLHQFTTEQLLCLSEATCSCLEARANKRKVGIEFPVPDKAIQLRAAHDTTQALALAHSRWGHAKLWEK